MDWRDGLRLILAGLAVFVGLMVAVGFIASSDFARSAPLLTAVISTVLFLVVLVGAVALFNARSANPLDLQTAEAEVRELEAAGLLVSAEFRAVRAFEVEEREDEGIHYFIELEDHRVLFLSGQYLYEYEAAEKPPRPRRFPCSEFTVRRHRDEGFVVDLVCRGRVLDPELVAPPFSDHELDAEEVPQDGEIITGESYERLKAHRAAPVR